MRIREFCEAKIKVSSAGLHDARIVLEGVRRKHVGVSKKSTSFVEHVLVQREGGLEEMTVGGDAPNAFEGVFEAVEVVLHIEPCDVSILVDEGLSRVDEMVAEVKECVLKVELEGKVDVMLQ